MALFLLMMSKEPSTLAANQIMAKSSMGHRYENLDWNLIQSRRDQCEKIERDHPWQPSTNNFLVFPKIFPYSEETAIHYENLSQEFELGNGIRQYVDVHMTDPHLFKPLLEFRKVIQDQGLDPKNDQTKPIGLKPYFLVAFATGDGTTLRKLINTFKPYHLIIALSDWHDFASSFWSLNWQELSYQQETVRKGKISIGCYKDGLDVLNFMISECHAGVDHAVIYLPPDGACNPKAKELREKISNTFINMSITYLGYTIDEHNMVWNSWQTLCRKPRVFSQPSQKINGCMVVCGSGPSLDLHIENLRKLSRTHRITACGSNFRTLKSYGIRVDFLALVERSDAVLSNVKDVAQEFDISETRLFMSSTCHRELQNFFCDSMIYFRPALTPLAIFSNSPSEILNFEGPESINTGIALASALGVNELVLIGVDLGTRNLQKVRSDHAVGSSVRDLCREAPGNFGGSVFTSDLLRDSRICVEACIRFYDEVKVFNASDGVAIEGAQPCHLEEYIEDCDGKNDLADFENSRLGEWWNGSQRYTPQRFTSSWLSRRPRAEVASLIQDLKELLKSDQPWSPDVIYRINKFLDLSVAPSAQFPRRILRSTVQKLLFAVNRQLIVLSDKPEQALLFERKARIIICNLLDDIEREIYDLCDSLESLSDITP